MRQLWNSFPRMVRYAGGRRCNCPWSTSEEDTAFIFFCLGACVLTIPAAARMFADILKRFSDLIHSIGDFQPATRLIKLTLISITWTWQGHLISLVWQIRFDYKNFWFSQNEILQKIVLIKLKMLLYLMRSNFWFLENRLKMVLLIKSMVSFKRFHKIKICIRSKARLP